MKHARVDYYRIQDLAEVLQHLEAAVPDFVKESGSLEAITAVLEHKYGRLVGVEPIPLQEPVFLVRSKDETAPLTVEFWSNTADAVGADPAIVETARDWAREMRRWQSKHGAQVPDMPEQGFCANCGSPTQLKGPDGHYWCSPGCLGG